jgi:hypothetical protein
MAARLIPADSGFRYVRGLRKGSLGPAVLSTSLAYETGESCGPRVVAFTPGSRH